MNLLNRLFVGLCCAASFGSAQAQEKPLIAFQSKGKLMVQTANGSVRGANQSEKTFWLTHKPQPLSENPKLQSPDGMYSVQVNDDTQDFTVQRVADSKTVFTGSQIVQSLKLKDFSGFEQAGDALPRFYGWLTRGHYLVVGTFFHVQEQNTYRRAVVDVATGSVLNFNGWLPAKGKYAVVPSQERVAKSENVSQSYFVGGSHRFRPLYNKYPTFYVATMPANLAAYRFNTAPKKRLTFNGKLLRFSLRSDILFSPDGQWAICNTSDFKAGSTPANVSFLIALPTGKVQKLGGAQALFLSQEN